MIGDLIDRQAVIEKMRNRKKLFCKNKIEFMALSKDEKARVDEIDNCIADLVNAPSAEPEPKWIPVSERLPEEKEMVLITNNKGHVRCGQYQGTFDDKNYRWWWKHNTLEEVIAWMPLPEPWRGE